MKKIETSQPERRLDILLESARLFSYILDLDVILKKLAALVSKKMDVEIVSIMLRENSEDRLVLKASRGLPERAQAGMSVPMSEGIAGWVARNAKPLLIEDLASDDRFSESSFSDQYSTKSLICVPIKTAGNVAGILSVNNKKDQTPFDRDDLDMLCVIAEQASMALDKALLYQRVVEEKKRVALVNELATSLMTTLKPGLLKNKVLRATCRLLKARGSSLLLYDREHDTLHFEAAVGPNTAALKNLTLKPGEGLAGWALTHGKSVLIRDARKDKRFWPRADEITGLKTASLIAVPLRSRGKVIGVLEVINRKDGGAFTEADRAFAEMIAAVVSLALDNNLLYHSEVKTHRRLESMVKKRTRELVSANARLRGAFRDMAVLKRFNEKIINNLASGLVIFDDKGFIHSINPPALKILGLDGAGRKLTLNRAFGDSLANSLMEAVATGQVPRIRHEFQVIDKGGARKVIGYTLSRVKYPPRGYPEWILLFHDLTEVKKSEEEMARLDRLVSLGEVSAHVAHELRNPLAAMYSSMQYLSGKVSGENRELSDVILDNMDRMASITQRMVLLSREIPLEKRKVDIRELVSQSLLFLDKTFREKKITVAYRHVPSPLWVEGDIAQLQQALFNVLMNAAQAMEGGGGLKVTLGRTLKGKRDTLTLVVTDSGPGIKDSLMNRIFDPFYTTKETGTGLGLAIAHKIFRSHGGKIQAGNSPGGGAVFTITLPLMPKGER